MFINTDKLVNFVRVGNERWDTYKLNVYGETIKYSITPTNYDLPLTDNGKSQPSNDSVDKYTLVRRSLKNGISTNFISTAKNIVDLVEMAEVDLMNIIKRNSDNHPFITGMNTFLIGLDGIINNKMQQNLPDDIYEYATFRRVVCDTILGFIASQMIDEIRNKNILFSFIDYLFRRKTNEIQTIRFSLDSFTQRISTQLVSENTKNDTNSVAYLVGMNEVLSHLKLTVEE